MDASREPAAGGGDPMVLIAAADGGLTGLLARVLAAEGFPCCVAHTFREALDAARRHSPHLAVVDSDIRDGSGLHLLDDLRQFDPAIAILLAVGECDMQLAIDAGRRGAYDFITKPFDVDKIPIRIRVALERRRVHLQEMVYRQALEQRINVRTKEVWDKKEKIRSQFLNTITALVKALQAKHDYTEGHSKRVADVSVLLARELKMPGPDISNIELAALFHDIGKIGLRDDVLNKCGGLTPAEYEHVKQHPLIAEQILSPIEDFAPILAIVKHEHERFDGKGYPTGLAGEEIPLGARIIAIADAYDALMTTRSYRQGCSQERALQEIGRGSGSQFDPKLVGAFVGMMSRPGGPSIPVNGNGLLVHGTPPAVPAAP